MNEAESCIDGLVCNRGGSLQCNCMCCFNLLISVDLIWNGSAWVALLLECETFLKCYLKFQRRKNSNSHNKLASSCNSDRYISFFDYLLTFLRTNYIKILSVKLLINCKKLKITARILKEHSILSPAKSLA